MNKLRLVLLIDDNPADNFLHEMLLMDIGVAEQVDAVSNGQEALDYIKACAGPQQLPADLCGHQYAGDGRLGVSGRL